MVGVKIELLIEFGVILIAPIIHTYFLTSIHIKLTRLKAQKASVVKTTIRTFKFISSKANQCKAN